MREDETHRLPAQADPEPSRVIEADGELSSSGALIQSVEADLAEQASLVLHDPGIGMRA